MESTIGLEGVVSDHVSSFEFDVTRFSLEDFETLSIADVVCTSPTNHSDLSSLSTNSSPLEGMALNGLNPPLNSSLKLTNLNNPTENAKRAFHSDDSTDQQRSRSPLTLNLKESKKPRKGILKQSLPPENFAARSSTILRQQKDKWLEKLNSLNRAGSFSDWSGASTLASGCELSPKDLRRVRFSFPLRSTSIIVPTSCKVFIPVNEGKEHHEGSNIAQKHNTEASLSESFPLKLLPQDVGDWYLALCRAKEEMPIERFLQILEEATDTQQNIDSINMSGESLSYRTIVPFADVLDLLKGLTRLELEDCDLDNESIKVLCSNLLISDRLLWLSLTNNQRITSDGFKYIATYINQSKQLKYLDLSCNPIDTKGAKLLARGVMGSYTGTEEKSLSVLSEPPTPTSPTWSDPGFDDEASSLEELKLNDCSLLSAELKVLCLGISHSNIRSLSLSGNKISPLSAPYIASLLAGRSKTNDSPRLTSRLTILDLGMNQLRSSGVEALLGALSNPLSRLEELNLGRNGIDSNGMAQLFKALKRNRRLHRLDLSHNPICGPSIEGLLNLKDCLAFNNTIRSLFLSETSMTSEGAIALAEVLPETKSLARLDISQNPEVQFAGLLALSVSARLNYSVTCLDVSIPPNNPELATLSQDMLNTCIRNTQLTDDLSFSGK